MFQIPIPDKSPSKINHSPLTKEELNNEFRDALIARDVDLIKKALDKGADVNIDNGRAILIDANIENIPMVKLLLKRGINKRLEVAIDKTNNPDIVKLLLKAGAVPDKEIYENADNKIKRIIEKYFPKFLGESNDKYKKLSVLGQGVYGKVFKVKNIETDQDYAMKTFLYEKAEGIPEDVIKELDILQRANHPNVVKAIDLMVEECKVEVILELADSSLKKFKGDDDVKLRYVFELLCGVNYLHINKIIHLDLKPDNLLIVNGVLKIADFGLATIVPNDKNQNDTVMTAPYRPPELLKEQKVEYSYEVDIWSVGCIIYELYMEKYLFYDQSVFTFSKDDILKIASNPEYIVKKLGEIENKNIAHLIKKCLQINPSSRITAKEGLQLFHELFNAPYKCSELFLEYKPFNINPIFTGTNIKMRYTLYKWLKDVAKKKHFSTNENTWFLAIDLMDRFWSLFEPSTKTLQLYACACFSISNKLIEYYHPKPLDYVRVSANFFTETQLINAECFILKTLNYIVYRPTLNVLFPKADKEKLQECLINNLVPSVIDNDPKSISNECVKSLL